MKKVIYMKLSSLQKENSSFSDHDNVRVDDVSCVVGWGGYNLVSQELEHFSSWLVCFSVWEEAFGPVACFW